MRLDTPGRRLLLAGERRAAKREFRKQLDDESEWVRANAELELGGIYLEDSRRGGLLKVPRRSRAMGHLRRAAASPAALSDAFVLLGQEAHRRRRFRDAAGYLRVAAQRQEQLVEVLVATDGAASAEGLRHEESILVKLVATLGNYERYAGDLEGSRRTFDRLRARLVAAGDDPELDPWWKMLATGKFETLYLLGDYDAIFELVEDLGRRRELFRHDPGLLGDLRVLAHSLRRIAADLGDPRENPHVGAIVAEEYARILECEELACFRRARRALRDSVHSNALYVDLTRIARIVEERLRKRLAEGDARHPEPDAAVSTSDPAPEPGPGRETWLLTRALILFNLRQVAELAEVRDRVSLRNRLHWLACEARGSAFRVLVCGLTLGALIPFLVGQHFAGILAAILVGLAMYWLAGRADRWLQRRLRRAYERNLLSYLREFVDSLWTRSNQLVRHERLTEPWAGAGAPAAAPPDG